MISMMSLPAERHRIGRPVPRTFVVSIVCLTLSMPFAVGEMAGVKDENGSASGILRGKVEVGPKLIARKARFTLYPNLNQQAAEVPEPSLQDEIGNVVIYLESVPWNPSHQGRKRGQLVMKQMDEVFEPHVLPILEGDVVEFPNSDPFFHNVFSLSTASAFDLGHYPKGDSRSVRFDKAGLVKVFCHLHSDMSALILVLDNPYFAVPDEQGNYRIEGIPPGKYRAVGWHERAKPIRREVEIRPGGVTMQDFGIPLDKPGAGD